MGEKGAGVCDDRPHCSGEAGGAGDRHSGSRAAARARECGFTCAARSGTTSTGAASLKFAASARTGLLPEGRVSGARKARILAHCRFGIQTCGAEAFGISVAEMVKAGAIVFAPYDGGQVEILRDPRLLFSNLNEAVEKIQYVLESPSLQSEMQAQLNRQATLFSAQLFMQESHACIGEVLDGHHANRYELTGQRS